MEETKKSYEICPTFSSPNLELNGGHFEHQKWVLNTTLSLDYFLSKTASIIYRGNFNYNILETLTIRGFTQRRLAVNH